MPSVDGFVAAVPTADKDRYIDHARAAGAIMMEHGATRIVECWGDNVPDGEVTSFPMAVKCRPAETVVFSWVIWPDKAAREAGWQKIVEDPRMLPDVLPMPFDGKRMIFGGFETVVEP